VVTSYHIIAGAASGFVRLVDQSTKYEIAGTFVVDEAHDLAVVAATGLTATPLHLGDEGQVAVGDEVYAVGNPQGLEGTFSQGIINAVRRVGGETVLQMTAPISRWLNTFALTAAAVAAALVVAGNVDRGTSNQLLNVSYDPTRELFVELNRQFVEKYANDTGRKLTIKIRLSRPVRTDHHADRP
jgi:S1-C subfamily serine protease